MERGFWVEVVVAVVMLVAVGCSPIGAARAEAVQAEVDSVEASHAAYFAARAAQDAAAERARSAAPLPWHALSGDPGSPREVIHVSPCADTEIVWHHDAMTDVCVGLCQTSADCLRDERCAGLDLGMSPDGQTVPFENVELPDGRVALGVCDPFWQTNPNVLPDAELP